MRLIVLLNIACTGSKKSVFAGGNIFDKKASVVVGNSSVPVLIGSRIHGYESRARTAQRSTFGGSHDATGDCAQWLCFFGRRGGSGCRGRVRRLSKQGYSRQRLRVGASTVASDALELRTK